MDFCHILIYNLYLKNAVLRRFHKIMLSDIMDRTIYITPQGNLDIEICQCGSEACESKHFFGPAIRNHYLVHYILEGQGIYKKGDKTYHLKEGQGFLISPFELTYYEADSENPWKYIWVGFEGKKAEELLAHSGLTSSTPVFENSNICPNMINMILAEKEANVEMNILGELYKMFALLIKPETQTYFSDIHPDLKNASAVQRAIDYIQNNIGKDISITQIANDLGYNRSYFSQLFKRETGSTIMRYVINYRMDMACKLLSEAGLRVSDVSRSIGYKDPLFFSRQFKKEMGMSPEVYRGSGGSG